MLIHILTTVECSTNIQVQMSLLPTSIYGYIHVVANLNCQHNPESPENSDSMRGYLDQVGL